jgi:polysaccharide export outer membrane protein
LRKTLFQVFTRQTDVDTVNDLNDMDEQDKGNDKLNTNRKRGLHTLILVLVGMLLVGCSNDILDPSQIGRFRPVPVINVILDSLGVADEPQGRYAEAEDPRPDDVLEYEQDYRFGTGDLVRVSIYELYREGTTDLREYVVTETGKISIPEVGLIGAAGLTENQLEEEIIAILKPNILVDPSVIVSLTESRSHVFSVSGNGVSRSIGRATLPRYPMRLREALDIAGGVGEFNVTNIYVARDVTGQESYDLNGSDAIIGEEIEPIDKAGSSEDRDWPVGEEDEMLEIIAPSVEVDGLVIASAEMVTAEDLALESMAEPTQFRDSAAKTNQNDKGRIEWVFEDGRWVPIKIDGGQTHSRPVANGVSAGRTDFEESRREESYGLEHLGSAGKQVRVIKIPVDKLLGGDPAYNIIIRPGDSITVPADVIGEFTMMGNVNRVGYIQLSGRPMTLKQAIAAAGGLNALAYPKKVEVVRRIGQNKEVTVMVDLDKIAKGLQPDFFIKQHDLINVGTHGSSRFLAVLRNAFRATYGFGFIYDRNLAIEDFGNDPFPGHMSLNKLF